MKNIVIGICSIIFFFLVLFTGYIIYGDSKRQKEVSESLNHALEQTIKAMKNNKTNAYKNDSEMIALFEELFLVQIDGADCINIHVMDVDSQKGILSVEVEEEYTKLNGRKAVASSRQTVFLDVEQDADPFSVCVLRFYVGQNLYRQYEVNKGEKLPNIPKPKSDKGTFAGWKEIANPASEPSAYVERDGEYYAVFN